MIIRLLIASTGALLVGSIGAFLLFVPVLSIATAVCILVGLLLMFGLGVQVGTQRKKTLPLRAELNTLQSVTDYRRSSDH